MQLGLAAERDIADCCCSPWYQGDDARALRRKATVSYDAALAAHDLLLMPTMPLKRSRRFALLGS